MKKILAIIGVAALLATVNINAAEPSYSQQTISPIPAVQTYTTNYALASAPFIDVSRSQVFSFANTMSVNAAGATNLYTLAPSVDNVYYDTNAADELLVSNVCLSSASGGIYTVNKSFTCSGIQSYKVVSITYNCLTGSITNLATYSGQKIASP